MNELALAQFLNVVFMPSIWLIGGIVIATFIVMLLLISFFRIVKFEGKSNASTKRITFTARENPIG